MSKYTCVNNLICYMSTASTITYFCVHTNTKWTSLCMHVISMHKQWYTTCARAHTHTHTHTHQENLDSLTYLQLTLHKISNLLFQNLPPILTSLIFTTCWFYLSKFFSPLKSVSMTLTRVASIKSTILFYFSVWLRWTPTCTSPSPSLNSLRQTVGQEWLLAKLISEPQTLLRLCHFPPMARFSWTARGVALVP